MRCSPKSSFQYLSCRFIQAGYTRSIEPIRHFVCQSNLFQIWHCSPNMENSGCFQSGTVISAWFQLDFSWEKRWSLVPKLNSILETRWKTPKYLKTRIFKQQRTGLRWQIQNRHMQGHKIHHFTPQGMLPNDMFSWSNHCQILHNWKKNFGFYTRNNLSICVSESKKIWTILLFLFSCADQRRFLWVQQTTFSRHAQENLPQERDLIIPT